MYGLAAIQQANGWAMAGAGACIVLTGLAVLSFLISMIPRISALLEEKVHLPVEPIHETETTEMVVPEKLPDDITAASTLYAAFTADLGEKFTLVDLHLKCKELGLPHPHLSINRFRDAGILVSTGEERFSWHATSD